MNNPKLRFKADDGNEFSAWEEKKICDISVGVRVGFVGTCEPYYTDESGIRLYRTGNIGENGLSENDMKYVLAEFHEKNKKSQLCKWDILIARHGESGRAVLYDKEQSANCLNIVIIHPDLVHNNPYFLCACINAPFVNKQVWKAKAGSTQSVINTGEVENLKIFIPSLPEQKKIAVFLSTIDDIIIATQSELTAWEERKKGVMQKIFNREVRFKADDGSEFPEWEERKFVDIFENMNNNTFSRDCLNYCSGFAKNIHYGDILVKFNSFVDVINDEIPYINKELSYSKYSCLQDGDIVIADTAEDETVGKAVEIENANNMLVVAGLHTIACRPKMKFAKRYLGYYLNSDTYHIQLRPYMQGIKVTSISKSNISLTKIMVPSLPEQCKIAGCLSSLDEVISQIQAELFAWKEFKKGLLQQMFV